MYKYSAWAENGEGVSLDVVLPGWERSQSLRALENAARKQLSSGWQVHILRHNFEKDSGGYFGSEEIKSFRIR